jgi:hypothetical protein
MDSIIVGIIVGLAAVWAAVRLFGRRKASACFADCAGCGHAGRPQPLVQIRR